MGSPRSSSILLCVLAFAACGDNITPSTPDATVEPDAPAARCGNLVIETGEDCDDGNLVLDAVCDSGCHFTCGNGLVDDTVGEACDSAISTGAGVCPTACNDNDACTTDVLSGSECTSMCVTSPITIAADGDGCCPAGANANTDNDCSAMCGNGFLEAGEVCDTGITAGAGACPTSCNDSQSCTTDTLMSANTCQATCVNTAITAPANGDGCCPAGANSGNDNDCSAVCGNGVLDANETCDTGILNGANSCPTSCNDNVACTSNVLSNPGTCTAACVYPAITAPANGDGCCPTGANATNDNDCVAMCGNGVVEGTEQCDDGNAVTTDACSNTCTTNVIPSAFRFAALTLRDPHAYVSFIGCADITDSFFGDNAVNQQLAAQMSSDGDNDGFLDLSPTIVFRPLDQGATATSPLEIHFAQCTAPVSTTTCSPGSAAPILATATNQAAGTCLTTLANTTRPYTPAVTSTTGPCFVSDQTTVTVDLAGIPLTLRDARIAATYVGNPASNVINGLLRGFITEADANATILPASLPLVGGKALSVLLPGGDPPGPDANCASHSDKDINNGVSGWWFYLNFTAPRTPWTD